MKRKTIKKRRAVLLAKQKKLEEQNNHIQNKLTRLRYKCKHKHMKQQYGTGECPDCGFVTTGWFCKKSPTKECEYYDEKNDVYDEDCCIYCGLPEERK